MCLECVRNGKMTQLELDNQEIEGVKVINQIGDLLDGKDEELVMNSLISSLIWASKDFEIDPNKIISALIIGFKLLGNEKKETLN